MKDGEKWANKHATKLIYECATWMNLETELFQEKVSLDFDAHTSASESEYAMDAGEGKGGRWTNHFFGKGTKPWFVSNGKVIKGIAPAGQEVPT